METQVSERKSREMTPYFVNPDDISTIKNADDLISCYHEEFSNKRNRLISSYLPSIIKKGIPRIYTKKYMIEQECDYMDYQDLYEIKELKEGIEDLDILKIERIRDLVYETGKNFSGIITESNRLIDTFFLVPADSKSKREFLIPVSREMGESGISDSEIIKLIPFLLEDYQADFYVKKILNEAENYNKNIKKCCEIVYQLEDMYDKNPDNKLSDHALMDIRIMNTCLENMAKKPYSPYTGAYAVHLNTISRRVGGEINDSFKSTIEKLDKFSRQKPLVKVDYNDGCGNHRNLPTKLLEKEAEKMGFVPEPGFLIATSQPNRYKPKDPLCSLGAL